jgi:hypothetical protein
MAIKDFQQIEAEDKELVKVQQNISKYVGQLNATTLDGVFSKEFTIGTSTTLVPHGLGRKFQGWHLLDLQSDARVWRDATSTADLTKFLPLRASTSVVVRLWVF